MLINGAWYLQLLPSHIIVEGANGRLYHTPASPITTKTRANLQPYMGYHPRSVGSVAALAVPEYIWKFYGFELAEIASSR